MTKANENDIIVSRYNNIARRRIIMRKISKNERTKQVQFRMSEKLHLELRKVLLENGMSMADLFNDTAKKYIEMQHQNRGEKSE